MRVLMRFEEIYIDGFGVFNDYHIQELTSDLSIFVGQNEAGKSTILSFIKRILFGFPDKRSGVNHYPPLAGGNHGGRLVVSTGNDERYIIERYSDGKNDVELTLPNGSNGGTSELSRLLGHANKDIFENIYAFGLTELQDFETLNKDAVKGRLYSAGTGIGAISLSEVQKKIETEAGRLFKLRGSKPDINTLFKGINEINTRLREIDNDLHKFDDNHRQLEGIAERIINTEDEQKQKRTELDHTANLIRVWDDWRKIQEDKERLEEIPKVKNFPENGIEMLERIKEKTENENREISKNKDSLRDIMIQRKPIEVDEILISNEENILELQKDQGKYISTKKALTELEATLLKDKDALRESLQEIGPKWNEEKLTKLDISLPTKENVSKKHKRIEEVGEKIHDIEKEAARIKEDIKNTTGDIKAVDKEIKTKKRDTPDAEKLQQQIESLRILRTKSYDLSRYELELRGIHEKEELVTALIPQQVEISQKIPFWPAIMLFVIGIVSMVLLILANSWAMGFFIFLLLSISSLAYLILSRKKSPTAVPEGVHNGYSEDRKKSSEGLFERKNSIESKLNGLKEEMMIHVKTCGFKDIPSPELIENRDSELQDSSGRILQLNELRKHRELLDRKVSELQDSADTLEKELDELRKQEEQIKQEWESWLIEKGLESELTPEGTIDIFAEIKTCKQKNKTIKDLEVRIGKVCRFIEEYENITKTVLNNCRRNKEKINVLVELERLDKDLKQSLENSRILRSLMGEEKNLELKRKELEKELKGLTDDKSKLFSNGSAKSEIEFRTNAENWNERKKLSEEIFQKEQNIKMISGDGPPYDRFGRELEKTNLEVLSSNKLQLEEEFRMVDEELKDLLEEKGSITNEIESIERREESSAMRLEKTVMMQKLKKKTDEWATLVLARTNLRKAIEKYEKERQPEVIKEAQSFYSRMTIQRYTGIHAPLDEETIYVIDKNSRRKEIQHLSRGTAEQLYLSLRFGFIREFSQRAEPLPIVFDDILVNFDPVRFKAACTAIDELSKTNQILYFTCHPETVNQLTKTVSSSRKVDLPVGVTS